MYIYLLFLHFAFLTFLTGQGQVGWFSSSQRKRKGKSICDVSYLCVLKEKRKGRQAGAEELLSSRVVSHIDIRKADMTWDRAGDSETWL